MPRFLLIILAFAFFVTTFGAEVRAQNSLGLPDPVRYTVSPETPGPSSQVLIQIEGVGNFLGNSTITWQINGKTVQSGIGGRSFNFTTGPVGSQTSVSVIINSPTQGTITKSFSFLPSSVNMIWEADTSAPPWYRGKSLYTAGSTLTVTALPQIISGSKTVSLHNLTFNWSRNGTPLPQQSGVGFNSITFKGNQLLAGETVDVDINLGDTTVAHGETSIPASKAQVLLYVRDPLRGVLYDTALVNSLSLNQTELTVLAAPYFFSDLSTRNGAISYDWELNNETATGPESANGILTLRQSGSGAGQASLQVSAQNTDSDKYIQTASAALQILFGGASAGGAFSSFFGL